MTAPPTPRQRSERLRELPTAVPEGRVLVHPTQRLIPRHPRGELSAWLQAPPAADNPSFEVCNCGDAPELGPHYRFTPGLRIAAIKRMPRAEFDANADELRREWADLQGRLGGRRAHVGRWCNSAEWRWCDVEFLLSLRLPDTLHAFVLDAYRRVEAWQALNPPVLIIGPASVVGPGARGRADLWRQQLQSLFTVVEQVELHRIGLYYDVLGGPSRVGYFAPGEYADWTRLSLPGPNGRTRLDNDDQAGAQRLIDSQEPKAES